MGTLSQNQTSKHNEAKNRQGRENLGGVGCERGESLCGCTEGSYETGVNTCTCYWMTHSSCPVGSSHLLPGSVNIGFSQQKNCECVCVIRQQQPRKEISQCSFHSSSSTSRLSMP